MIWQGSSWDEARNSSVFLSEGKFKRCINLIGISNTCFSFCSLLHFVEPYLIFGGWGRMGELVLGSVGGGMRMRVCMYMKGFVLPFSIDVLTFQIKTGFSEVLFCHIFRH